MSKHKIWIVGIAIMLLASVISVNFVEANGIGVEEEFRESGDEYEEISPIRIDGDDEFAGGEGTEEEPYEIENWTHLNNVREHLDQNFTLNADLNETTDGYDEYVNESENGWEPIGNSDSKFQGIFDGNNSQIRDLYINRSDKDFVGLFGFTDDSKISNLMIIEANVEGKERVGILTGGQLDGVVNNSYSTGDVKGNTNIGGLVGDTGGTITESYAEVNVTGESDESENVGGLAGSNSETIENSYAIGEVEGETEVGGLVGENDGKITESHAEVNVTGESENVGGLVGSNSDTIEDSSAKGEVEGETEVGGLVGENDGKITESHAEVNVTGESDESENVGGLAGSNSDTIENSYAIGEVEGETKVGGLVGESDIMNGNEIDSFFDNETTDQKECGGDGIPKNTTEMYSYSTYTDTDLDHPWDIARVEAEEVDDSEPWNIVDGWDYPFLSWDENPVEAETDFELIDWDIVPDHVDAGEDFEVKGYVKNTGNVDETVELTFEIDEKREETKTIDDLSYGESDKITFIHSETELGTYNVTVDAEGDDNFTGKVEVQPGDATSVKVETEPKDTRAGQTLTGNDGDYPKALVTDDENNTVKDVEVSVEAIDGAGDLTDYSTTEVETEEDGLATFDELIIEEADDDYKLEFSIDRSDDNVEEDDDAETTKFTVKTADTDHIEVEPTDPVVEAGEAQEFNATAYDEYRNERDDVTDDVEWDDDIDDASWNDNEITPYTAGEWNITGGYEGMEDTATLKVEPTDVDSVDIEIDSEYKTIEAGKTVDIDAEASDEYGNTVTDDETDFDWTGADDGVFDETEAGDHEVKASHGEIESDTITIEVEPSGVDTVEITEEGETVEAGEPIEFNAESSDEYGNLITDDLKDFTWQNASLGTFEETEAGEYQVTAEYEDVGSELTIVTVEPSEVSTVEIEPEEDQNVTVGGSIEFSAEAYDEYENLISDDDGEFTWSNASEEGTFEEEQPGEYEVKASYEQETSDAVLVTVGGQLEEPEFEVLSIEIDPEEPEEYEEFEIEVEVENKGEVEGEYTAEITLDGETIDSDSLEIEPGKAETITVTHTIEDADEYNLVIEDADESMKLTVEEKEEGFLSVPMVFILIGIVFIIIIALALMFISKGSTESYEEIDTETEEEFDEDEFYEVEESEQDESMYDLSEEEKEEIDLSGP